MDHEILFQGPGYTIARSFTAETLVPYVPSERGGGNQNYGWVDLRDHPERVDFIPEAKKCDGLARLLRVIAVPESRIMSSACECAAFHNIDRLNEAAWHVGGFVEIMFKDDDRNADSQNLIDLAAGILSKIGPSSDHHVGYELIIEPLKTFFGRLDCYGLMLKSLGCGPDEETAWAAFDDATRRVADAIEKGRIPKAG